MMLHGCVFILHLSLLDLVILSSSKHFSCLFVFFFFCQAAWLLPKSQLIWNNQAVISRIVHRVHFFAPLVACLLCLYVGVCVKGRYRGVERSQEMLNVPLSTHFWQRSDFSNSLQTRKAELLFGIGWRTASQSYSIYKYIIFLSQTHFRIIDINSLALVANSFF